MNCSTSFLGIQVRGKDQIERYLREADPFVTSDSEWSFALFLSKVFCAPLFRARVFLNVIEQLPDPHAAKFSTDTLRQAMYETIQSLNEMTEAIGATEVCPQWHSCTLHLIYNSLSQAS